MTEALVVGHSETAQPAYIARILDQIDLYDGGGEFIQPETFPDDLEKLMAERDRYRHLLARIEGICRSAKNKTGPVKDIRRLCLEELNK